MRIKKYLRNLIYETVNIDSLDYKPKNPIDNNIVVSLTTIPSRISYIKPVIYSLLRQIEQPRIIELNLAVVPLKKDIPWEIPNWLERLDAVKIFWLDHDYGPASKFIPTLLRHKEEDSLVIVVDDDMLYPKDLIKSFMNADVEIAGRCVAFCANGHPIARNLNFADSPSDKRIKKGNRRVAIVEGCGGYCVRSRYFDLGALEDISKAPNGAIIMDDIWISGHLSRQGVSKIQIPTSKRKSLFQSDIVAIPSERLNLNNKMLEYFSQDWKEEELV